VQLDWLLRRPLEKPIIRFSEGLVCLFSKSEEGKEVKK